MDKGDVYRIARLLVDEHGAYARDEVKERLAHYVAAKDYNAIKAWYEIEDALEELQAHVPAVKEQEEVLN